LHVLDYGDAGGKKSTFASSFPKPMHVLHFDAHGKDRPYLRRGTPSDVGVDDLGVEYRLVYSKRDPERVIIRVSYFIDPDPTNPSAYSNFLKTMARLHHEFAEYKTYVIDSLTFFEFAARNHDQYRATKSKDGRKAYGASKDAVEQICFGRLASMMDHNVVVIAHIDEEKDDVHGTMIRNPAAPGKLSKRLPAGFPELYHSFVGVDAQGNPGWWLQTQADRLFNAASQIPAPNPCEPEYEALWAEAEG
jgi:hypothetical protein